MPRDNLPSLFEQFRTYSEDLAFAHARGFNLFGISELSARHQFT
jgi:hypothetical protein